MTERDAPTLASHAADCTVFGAKIAVTCGNRLITYLRDDLPTIPNPGEWDLPGGEREPGESALACALRETREEFGISLDDSAVVHAARYHKYQPHRIEAVFFAAEVSEEVIASIVFGDEGQCWTLMAVDAFVSHPKGVSELQRLTGEWWRRRSEGR